MFWGIERNQIVCYNVHNERKEKPLTLKGGEIYVGYSYRCCGNLYRCDRGGYPPQK